MSAAFVHLRVHSEYSLVDSVVRIPALVKAVAEAGMPAVAITDQCNLFALVKFYRAAEAMGVKPIIGADTWLRPATAGRPPARLALLCQDRTGYRNLSRLLTRAYLERDDGLPTLAADWLAEHGEGLIGLCGSVEGELGQALVNGRDAEAEALLRHWSALLPGRLYVELQRTGRAAEEDYNHAAVAAAAACGLPLVATNDVCFLEPDDFEAHEARVCIHDGHTLADSRRPRRYSDQQFLRTPRQMQELFEELPEALANSVEIARRCNLELDLGRSVLPVFPVPEGRTVDDHLRQRSEQGLRERLERAAGTLPERYTERLAHELGVIEGMGYSGYFLIVADFIRWAREQQIPVGPGRGSGAGSLVAYALAITDLDPLAHDLLFERFLNPERVSMPDFDVDFCMDGRDRVIGYVAERYGRDRVSQIITFGSMAARAVVRDVGRVLGHPFGFVDRIAKLIPFEIGMTLDKALAQDEELRGMYGREEEVRSLIDLARALEGLARNPGKHAGGVVIAPGPLTEFTPLYCESGGDNVVTQYDKDDVEAVGLVKFDFLGLRTLTIIDRAVAVINREREHADEAPLVVDRLPMDDPAAYALLKRCATTAVFQLESRGMKDLIKRLQPDCFDDIVALVALYRPGPLQSGMVDDFIRRKHGEAPIDYPHPEVEGILRPTYGVILYQEQVMQIAQTLAGYSLGGADLLRRAMGKKKPEEMAKQRSVFVDGARGRGVDGDVATHIFDLMEKFAGYGFNKSHSAAYAVLSYQTAWLKAHYPAAFMAAVLSADMDNTDKVVTLIDECHNAGLTVLPPDINASGFAFDVAGEQAIRYGLGAIRGVGRSAVETIIAERQASPYRDVDDLCARIDLQRVNKRVLEALVRAGALDRLGPNRASLMARLPTAVQTAEQHARATAAGQDDLFGLGAPTEVAPAAAAPTLPEWSDAERLAGERDTLGLFLTGHPVAEFEAELAALTSGTVADLIAEERPVEAGWRQPRRQVTAGGLVLELRRRGPRLALVLDDRTARVEVMLFDDVHQQYRHLLARDAIVLIEGTMRYDDYADGWRITARRVLSIDQARERHARRLLLRWRGADGGAFVRELREALEPFRGGNCAVTVCYQGGNARARLELGEEWCVNPTGELLRRLHALVGAGAVEVRYPHRIDIEL